jgi:hypothetical protein
MQRYILRIKSGIRLVIGINYNTSEELKPLALFQRILGDVLRGVSAASALHSEAKS